MHLIRASMRFVSYGDRKAVAAALRPIYTASTEDAARCALDTFADSTWARSTPPRSPPGSNAWDRFTPFLAFGPALRKVIYTTNAIESLNYQLRKIIKNRGHFPNDAAAIKLLWLAIMQHRGQTRPRTRQGSRPAQRDSPQGLRPARRRRRHHGWKAALAELALVFPDRINPYL